jgi:hypothetical protein
VDIREMTADEETAFRTSEAQGNNVEGKMQMGKVHHFMTGDKMKGFVCHECGFTTDKVEEAANHNFWEVARGSTICPHGEEPYDCRICFPVSKVEGGSR